MKHILPLLAVCATTGLMAQPTLTAADLTPIFGSTITYYEVDYVAPGPATANFIFNVGNPVAEDTTTVELVQPSATPNGSLFPNATYAAANFSDFFATYTYFRLDPGSLQQVGSEFSGYGSVYSDGMELISLPCTMGSTWADTYAETPLDPGDMSEYSGSLTGQCNGYGTLVLPYGTFSNVLRVETHSNDTTLDPINGDVTSFSTAVSYYVAGMPLWLFQTVTNTTTYPGQTPSTSQGSTVMDAASVGIEEAMGNGPTALLFPNPANDAFTLVFDSPVKGNATITLLDALGRKVSDLQQTNAMANATTMNFDVSSVPRGMYIVRVQDVQGRSSNMPLVLH